MYRARYRDCSQPASNAVRAFSSLLPSCTHSHKITVTVAVTGRYKRIGSNNPNAKITNRNIGYKCTNNNLKPNDTFTARHYHESSSGWTNSSATLYAAVLMAGTAAGGITLILCQEEKKSNSNDSTDWNSYLPPWLSPSSKSTISNQSNVSPVSTSSVEAAAAMIDAHAGEAIANRGLVPAQLQVPGLLQQIAQEQISHLPVEMAVLTKAPRVPPPLARDYPVLLKVNLETTTRIMQLTNTLKYEFWTFNDMVPGPMIRARVGDVIEINLKNTDQSANPHNIDCHGFEGPGGGAPITTAQLDETKTARFKCLYPGLFVYHCAAAPVPAHIMNGMYGMMLVESEQSILSPADREYYVMQSEFYYEPLDNSNGNRVVEPSYPRGLDETADAVVFNGKESSLTIDSPLQAKTGELVRIYFGNAGPNYSSSFHLIGGIFDKVYRDADLISPPGRFIQTVAVPPGGASVLEVRPVVPGTYTLIDHAIFRLDKGAVGYLNVTGGDRADIYAPVNGIPQPCPGCKLHP